MHLDRWNRRGNNRIPQSYARMGQGGCVDHHGVGPPDRLVDQIDQLAFLVGLHEPDLDPSRVGIGLYLLFDLFQCGAAIVVGFTAAQQIQVWAIQDQNPSSHISSTLAHVTDSTRHGSPLSAHRDPKWLPTPHGQSPWSIRNRSFDFSPFYHNVP